MQEIPEVFDPTSNQNLYFQPTAARLAKKADPHHHIWFAVRVCYPAIGW